MAGQGKLYAGAKLREIRARLGLTQAVYAAKLGVSTSYLNQMENNNRPLSARVVLALANGFGVDVGELAEGSGERVLADLAEALADPVFADTVPPKGDLTLVASNAPNFARAFLALHRSYRHAQDRLAQLNQALDTETQSLAPLPWEEVRDFFHYRDNHVDEVDRAAEAFATALAGRDRRAALAEWLEARHGVQVVVETSGSLRRYDPATRRLAVSAAVAPATQAFQILHQIALIAHDDLLEDVLAATSLSEAARDICKLGLANYFAGAAMLPYGAFLARAQALRHDLDALALAFEASVEQVAQRLSSMQRRGARGVPVFFVRVDQAGTITKRHSSTQLQFARFGGACPLWNVHQAFEAPGQILRQLAETPDGTRFLSLAREVSKPRTHFHAPVGRFAIALGCEISHARHFVYADDLDLGNDAAYQKIGVSCRICSRTTCAQRSVPPLKARLRIDPNGRDVLPYEIEAEG